MISLLLLVTFTIAVPSSLHVLFRLEFVMNCEFMRVCLNLRSKQKMQHNFLAILFALVMGIVSQLLAIIDIFKNQF
jgi:hypothetical protein